MNHSTRLKVLFVDDEVQILESLKLNVRRHFEVLTATSGAAGLLTLKVNPDVAVIVSDMRMPEMNGAAFLVQAKALVPDATRLLLTGYSEIDAAISAINDGHVFRFITKPCPSTTLIEHLNAAAIQYQLVTSERVLLQETLHGSIKTLLDVLALSSPAVFGRATRLRDRAATLARALKMDNIWQIEIAAMLSQLGCIILPKETLDQLHEGKALSTQASEMVMRVPAVSDQLLANIPRLEAVRATIVAAAKPEFSGTLTTAADVLRFANEWDGLETKKKNATLIATILCEKGCDPEVVKFAADAFSAFDQKISSYIPIHMLQVGMRLVDDVKNSGGLLLVARGYVITESFIERLRNMDEKNRPEQFRVLSP